MTEPVYSFAPVTAPGVRVLVLGSMPGVRSLADAEYYAHPRNAFWPIVEDLLGVPRSLPYDARLVALAGAGVALWDVLASCVRPGSLDSNIVASSVVPNDVPALLAAHPSITHVLLNGGAAAKAFRRHHAPALRASGRDATLTVEQLPSTSPAHAARTYEAKRDAWAAALPAELLAWP